MQENDAVAFALLRVGGGDEEADVETSDAEDGRQRPEPRDHSAGQRIERLWPGKAVPVEQFFAHSRAIRKAAAVGHGAKNTPDSASAASNDKCA